MASNDVYVQVHLDYRGTQITKAVIVRGEETDVVKVVRALEQVSTEINGMVQIEQSARNQEGHQ
jgi:hypothetical protein